MIRKNQLVDNPKWWNVAVVALAVALSVMLLAVPGLPSARMLAAQATLVGFVIAWFTLGRLAWQNRGAAVAFILLAITLTGVGTALYPSMATLQTVAYPLIWVISNSTRKAIVANVALALAVAVGFVVGLGFTPGVLLQAVFIVALSLGFSIALGLWITHIFDLSTERQQLLDELKSAESKLASLHRESGVASERERISRELHDTLAQDLTGLVMLAQGARRDLDAADLVKARSALELVEESARNALIETRSLVASGAAVEMPGGIVPALQRLSERFERETGVTVTALADDPPALDRGTEVVLLRCAQEALANIRKHSHATSATVTARGVGGEGGEGSSGGDVELCVTDNGVGFADDATTSGFGLAGMHDRLALVDGTLTVDSSATGTTLTVRVPVALPA